MKKHLSIILILAIAFGAICTLASCNDPTAGLDEVSFEDILNADLCSSYDIQTVTKTFDAEGHQTDKDETITKDVGKSNVKILLLKDKVAVETAKKTSENNKSRVCANKSYTRIVTYAYTVDSNNVTRLSVITTYTKH